MKALCFLVLLLTTTTVCAQDCGGMVYAGGTCVPPDVAMPKSQQPQTQPSRQGLWVDMWGALVMDSANGALGASQNKQTEAEAWKAATADCMARGGGESTCTHWFKFKNQCAVIVVGNSQIYAATGGIIEEATKLAMHKCSSRDTNCKQTFTDCSLPVVIP